MLAIMPEFGIKIEIIVKSDAVAAIGIVQRQGLGRIRHLAVADLWIQQKSKDKIVKYVKLPGTDNTSDMLTKAVEAPTIEKHMQTLDLEFRTGRHEATPTFNGQEDGTPDVGR